MILDYNRKPDATVDEKIQSLMENTQLALNDIIRAQQTADVAKEDAQTSVALSQTARQAANEASESAARAKEAADEATEAVEEIEGDVSSLTTRVAQAESDIDTAEGNITSLTGRVADAEGDITTIEGNVSSLAGRVADAEADISTAEGNISTLQSDVATAQGNISTIQGNITNLSGRVSDAESDITTVEGNITTLTGRVSDAEDEVAGVMKGLALAEDVVGTLTWITAHSTVTTDTTPQQGTVYYIKHLDGTFEAVTDTTGKNPAQEGWYVLDEALQNYVLNHLALTDEGLWVIKDGSGYKLKLTDYGSYIVAPDGTTVVNQNTADGNIIRALDGTVIAHLGYGEGQSASGTAEAPYYTLGTRASGSTIGNYSVAEGINVTAADYGTHAEGMNTVAQFGCSHAEGRETAAIRMYSHAEGYGTTAKGDTSHAEGCTTTASGVGSHAEGYSSHTNLSRTDGIVASGDGAHAEGWAASSNSGNIIASGDGAHAEGYAEGYGHIVASGKGSHAQNCNTKAEYDYQTAIGKYNRNKSDTAFEIGNGTDNNNRSNAFAVDWTGNVEAAGDITDGNGNVLSDKVDSVDVYTKTQTDALLADYVLKATPYYELDTTATSGTDKEIYDALVDLGWDSDVIV